MAKLTPRKFTKLPWIREAVGSRCEELARELRHERMWSAIQTTPSEPGDILAVIGRSGEITLISETVSSGGVRTRQRTTSLIESGQLSRIPREDGAAHLARAVVVPRLYGHRNIILDRVQAEIHRRDGVRMSTAWIEACWDDFLNLQKALSNEKY